jgi:hypothetical protein
MNDEFYIGWQEKAPARTARVVRVSVLTLIGLTVMSAALIGLSQQLIGRSVFEWGKVREFSGVLRATPVPHLVDARGGTNQFYYLVRPWKFGFAPELAAKFDGQEVTLRGTLIYRDDQQMIEVEGGSVNRSSLGPAETQRFADSASESFGEQTFMGEIVDSKCFLGVMNPGQLKPHRACAVRCISGGVPPVLLVRESNGIARYLLLVSRDGKPVNRQVLELVAEPLRIHGELVRQGEMLVLRADPSTYQRIP